jgi:predicted RNA-binding Zn ribbon-like protein
LSRGNDVQPVTPETIPLRGGRLCLDYANTVDWSAAREPVAAELDALRRPDWLGRWGQRMGLLPGGDAPRVTARELRAAHALRAAIYAVFAAVAEREPPPAPALALLARQHAQAAGAARLAWRGSAGRLAWDAADPRLVRFSAAADAVALLADERLLARVRRCPGRDCGWLFLDASGRRRWCSMRTCGSREKMRRLRAR